MTAPGVLLGFDYGTKRIGVAVGQTLTGTASALSVIDVHNGRPDWDAIGRLLAEWKPVAVVVGRPCSMDGSEHELTKAARRFGNQLAGRYNLTIHTVDERLTSFEAELELRGEGGRAGKQGVDAVAARLILQTWLDQCAAEAKR